MKRFLNWLCHTFPTHLAPAPHRPVRPELEQLDERIVPSSDGGGSAISIYHPGSWHWIQGKGGWYSPPWTEKDWCTIDQSTGQVVEVQGTSRHNLGGPSDVKEVTASVDPNTGFGQVFALAGPYFNETLWRCDSLGTWHSYGGVYSFIPSATRDGHVYVVTGDGSDVRYMDSNGNVTDLGNPNPNMPGQGYGLAASHSLSGGNEVFALGRYDYSIYVNSANAPGQWRLVDNSKSFFEISAAQDDTVFAVAFGRKLYQETESFYYDRRRGHWSSYWSSQDISGGMVFNGQISADTDSLGRDEVYAVGNYASNYQAFRYDQGSWTFLANDVSDISGADDGYFYLVQNFENPTDVWEFNPNSSPYWTYLGRGLA
jgi:hypothetical protein